MTEVVEPIGESCWDIVEMVEVGVRVMGRNADSKTGEGGNGAV